MTQTENGIADSLFFSYFSLLKPHKSNDRDNEWRSHVLPHSAIAELAANLWHVTGFMPFSVAAPREMVVYKLPDSSLLLHSAIALDEQTMAQLETLGTPKIMVVPNRIHRRDAAVYKQRYPQLMVVCPAAAKTYVEEVVPVDGIAEEILPAYQIRCHEPAGIRPQELVYELPLPNGKALVFTDILFNLQESYIQQYVRPLAVGKVGLRLLGASGYFGITRLGQKFFMRDRDAYRQWLEELANSILDLRVICVAHGTPIQTECNQRLKDAAARLC